MHDLSPHRLGQRRTIKGHDPLEHHVDAGGAAGAGETSAFPDVAVRSHFQLRELLAKGRHAFPVQRHRIALQYARPGQDKGCGVHPPKPDAMGRQSLEQRQILGTDTGFRLIGRHHHQTPLGRQPLVPVGLGNLRQTSIDIDAYAIAGRHRLAIGGQQAPGKQIPTKTVGHPKRLEQAEQRQHRKLGHQPHVQGVFGLVGRQQRRRVRTRIGMAVGPAGLAVCRAVGTAVGVAVGVAFCVTVQVVINVRHGANFIKAMANLIKLYPK